MSARPAPTFFLVLLAALPGCYLFNPNTDPPAQATQCHAEGTSGPKSTTREVALGDGTGTHFKPYSSGGSVTLVQGGQGLSMVTPAVRVKAESGDPSEICLLVSLLSESPGGGGPGGAGGGGGATGGAGGGGGGAGGSGGGATGGAGGTGGASGAGGATGSGSFSGSGSGEGEGPSTLTQGAKFVLTDGYLVTDGVLYNPVYGGTVLLTVTVTGEDFTGIHSVKIVAE